MRIKGFFPRGAVEQTGYHCCGSGALAEAYDAVVGARGTDRLGYEAEGRLEAGVRYYCFAIIRHGVVAFPPGVGFWRFFFFPFALCVLFFSGGGGKGIVLVSGYIGAHEPVRRLQVGEAEVVRGEGAGEAFG